MEIILGEVMLIKNTIPELASIRISADEVSNKRIGHRVLPVIGLCPGFHHLSLRNELDEGLCCERLCS